MLSMTAHALARRLAAYRPPDGRDGVGRACRGQARGVAPERMRRAHGSDTPPTSEPFVAENGGGGSGAGTVGPIIGMLQARCERCGRARNETGAALNRSPCRRV